MNYKLHIVSFTVCREGGPGHAGTKPLLQTPEAVAAIARQMIPDDAKEHFWTLLLDTRNRLVAAHEVSTGTLSASLVHPREVFGPALRILGVAPMILVHNHPSGDPTPSREDRSLTHQLVEPGKLLDIKVHDHIVIGNGSADYISLAQRGML